MIKTVYEPERGCGRKKAGGLYLIGGGFASACCKLPFALTVCPCCNAGIKFSRGFTWIDSHLFGSSDCNDEQRPTACPIATGGKKLGLMWVGEKYYTVESFLREAWKIGVSKRIARLPKDLVIGHTWIALAHKKVIYDFSDPGNPLRLPGVFALFRVTDVQYVCRGDESEEQLSILQERGVTPVTVKPISEPQTIEL